MPLYARSKIIRAYPKNNGMKVFVRARPLAKARHVEKLDASHFTVAVVEPPKNGEANRAITEALAEHFSVSPSRIRLVSGFSSKQKIFEIL